MPILVLIISFVLTTAIINVQVKVAPPSTTATSSVQKMLEVETTITPIATTTLPTTHKTKINIPSQSPSQSKEKVEEPITIPPIYIVLPSPPPEPVLPVETPPIEATSTPPIVSTPAPKYVSRLSIQMKVNGEEVDEITVNKGEEITLYWLVTGETARCRGSFPSGEEVVYEEQTRKIVVDSDFIFQVKCTGNNSGTDIKNSIEIKTQ